MKGFVCVVKERIITAVIGVAVCLLALIFGGTYPIIIAVGIGLVAALMTGEFLLAKGMLKEYSISVLCLLFSFAMSVTVNFSLRSIPIYLFTFLIFAVMIINYKNITFDKIAFAYTGTLLIAVSMACVSALAYSSFSIYYVSLSLAVPWLSDTGAYFIGTFFGKNKLCPQISPKKTVEGAIGGLVFGVLGGVAVSLVFSRFIYTDVSVNYLLVAPICLVLSVISVIGDLTFSLIKRSCNIKDFGSIMPGHGGFCDRFDSVVFTAPLLLIISKALPLMCSI